MDAYLSLVESHWMHSDLKNYKGIVVSYVGAAIILYFLWCCVLCVASLIGKGMKKDGGKVKFG